MGRHAGVLRVAVRGQRRELDGDRMEVHTQGDGGGQTCAGQTLWTRTVDHTGATHTAQAELHLHRDLNLPMWEADV